MKPVYQTIIDPGKGNCWAACIASILELPISEVPNFVGQLEYVSKGFDWTNGQLIMEPSQWLNNIPTKEISLLREFWLKKHSNRNALWKTPKGQPFVAEYKKLVSPPFERESQAQLWISDRMREDIENLLK